MKLEDVLNAAWELAHEHALRGGLRSQKEGSMRAAIEAYGAECARGERERCAKLAETLRPCQRGDCDDLAAAIRKV